MARLGRVSRPAYCRRPPHPAVRPPARDGASPKRAAPALHTPVDAASANPSLPQSIHTEGLDPVCQVSYEARLPGESSRLAAPID